MNYLGSGGILIGGNSEVSFNKEVLGSGGIQLSGSAEVKYHRKLNAKVTGRGGIILSGQALVHFISSGGIVDNELWNFTDEPVEEFQNFRPLRQANPFFARDEGPEEIGFIENGILGTEYTLEYKPETGEFQLNGETIYNVQGVTKVDLTFDVWGHPFILYILKSGQLYVRFWDEELETYHVQLLDTESSYGFCCNAERRLPWSYRNNKIYVVYIKNREILYRSFQEQLFAVARRTAYTNVPRVDVAILGFGLDKEHKLQILSRHVSSK